VSAAALGSPVLSKLAIPVAPARSSERCAGEVCAAHTPLYNSHPTELQTSPAVCLKRETCAQCDTFCLACSLAQQLAADSTTSSDADAEHLQESSITENFAAAQHQLYILLCVADIFTAVPAAVDFSKATTAAPQRAEARAE
jgi:hypothetical protein